MDFGIDPVSYRPAMLSAKYTQISDDQHPWP